MTFSEDGSIIDVISGQLLKDTPEERVRQQFINLLQVDYGYPIDLIRREIPIQQGSKIMLRHRPCGPAVCAGMPHPQLWTVMLRPCAQTASPRRR